MNVLSFSYCFPKPTNPSWGVFVAQRLGAIGRLVDLRAAAPVPWFPVVTRLKDRPGPLQDRWGDLTVYRPRFFYLPGLLKTLDGRLYARGLQRWFKTLCDRWRPDVLDAHFVWPDGVGVARLARQRGIPYVITLRGQLYPCADDGRREQCVDALLGAAAVISVSTPMADLARELGVPDDRISVISNGVDTEAFQPRDKAAARRELGLPAAGRLIVTVAHLGPRKGSRETIQALADLPSDVRLVLVGGDGEGAKNTEAIRDLAAKLGLGDRVVLAGRQPYRNVPLYFNAADVSVLASYREGCPNVVLESLASGTPVVASNVGAVPDLLSSPGAGRIVPARQVEPLARALTDVLGQEHSAREIATSDSVASWDTVARRACGVLEAAAQHNSSA